MTARCGTPSKLVMRVPFPSPALVVAAQVTAPISCRQRSSESGVPVVCPSGRVTTLLLVQPRQGHEALGEERAEDGRVIVTAGARKRLLDESLAHVGWIKRGRRRERRAEPGEPGVDCLAASLHEPVSE